jgi:putative heme-binding domain-containing protein
MYFVTGGRKTKSALYRVSYTGLRAQPRALTKAQSNRDKRAKAFREERKKAELHHSQTKFVFELNHTEPRIRNAWRIALEHNQLTPKKEDTPNFENLTAHDNINSATGKAKVTLLDNWTKFLPSEQLAYLDLIRRNMERHELPTKTLKAIQSNLEPHFPNSSIEINLAIAPLLIRLNPAKAVGQTVKLLDASASQRERIYYLYHLRHATKGWTNESRRIFFRILGTYDTFLGGRGLPQSLKKIRTDSEATLSKAEKKELATVIKQKPALPPLPDLTGRELVKQWKLSDFADALDFDATQRDLANGKKMFSLAMCSRCHRNGREGYPIGPDLTQVSSRFGHRDLLGEILEPSRTIAENYQTSVLKLKDGRQLAGQIIPNLDYRASTLQLAENPLYPDKITRIPKMNIAQRSHSKISLMPPGLLNLLSREEVLDLLAWLQTTGK